MAHLVFSENPKRKRRKKRNPSATQIRGKAKNPVALKRRTGTTKAGALSFAKKNGMKLVKASANPRKKTRRRRRNGLAVPRSRNGIFASGKQDAKVVGALALGAILTFVGSKFLNQFLQGIMTQIGIGNYSMLVSNGTIAMLAAPFLVEKVFGKTYVGNARAGGLMITAFEAANQFVPQLSPYLPYGGSAAVVINNGQPLLTPGAVKEIVNATNAPAQDKAKVAGAMDMLAMQTGDAPTYSNPTFAGAAVNNQDEFESQDW